MRAFDKSRSWAVRLGVATFALFFAVAAAELVLRLTLPEVNGYYVWWPSLRRIFQVEEGLMPGIDGPTLFQVNSQGFRGDEISEEDDYRVLCVGGSTTECLFLDQPDAWPEGVERLLNARQQALRVWVGNAGKSGLNTRDHIVQLKKILPPHPEVDAVVLMIGVNDMMLRLSRDAKYDPDFMQGEGAEDFILPRSFQMLPLDREGRKLSYQKTALWRLASRVKDALFQSNKVQDNAGSNIKYWREHRRTAPAFRDRLPDMTPGLEEYRRNIRELIRLCRDHGARPIFMTQPAVWRADLAPELLDTLWLGGIGDYMETPGCTYYGPPALIEAMGMYNDALKEVCAEEEVDCYDIAGDLPCDPTFFYDDVHFNTAGGRRVAELFGEYLLQDPPFDG